MYITQRLVVSAGCITVWSFVAGLVSSPANAVDPAQQFEQLKQIKPPQGYVLHDTKECPQGARTLALAVPDPRDRGLAYASGRRPVLLLLLAEEVAPELEIGPETFDLEIKSLSTASWLGDGESFVFVAFPRYDGPDPELMAQRDEIEEEMTATDPEEERDRYVELARRHQELGQEIMEEERSIVHTTALFRCDAATGEVERLWDINEEVRDVDVDGEGFIHVALPDNQVYVLTPDGEHVTSHAVPNAPEESYDIRCLDASSQTIWATMVIVDHTQPGFRPAGSSIVRLRYGGGEPEEWEVVVEDGSLKEIAPSGAALLYETRAPDSEDPANFVYNVETEKHTRVPATRDLLGGDLRSGSVGNVSLAPDGSAVRYQVLDLELQARGDPVDHWENTILLEYTLPE